MFRPGLQTPARRGTPHWRWNAHTKRRWACLLEGHWIP